MGQYFPAVKRMKNGYFIGYFTFTPNFIRITFSFEGGQTLLAEAQLAVYNILKRDNMASRQSIEDNLGINPFAVQKHMDSLKKSGYIQRVGTFKGYWRILK